MGRKRPCLQRLAVRTSVSYSIHRPLGATQVSGYCMDRPHCRWMSIHCAITCAETLLNQSMTDLIAHPYITTHDVRFDCFSNCSQPNWLGQTDLKRCSKPPATIFPENPSLHAHCSRTTSTHSQPRCGRAPDTLRLRLLG